MMQKTTILLIFIILISCSSYAFELADFSAEYDIIGSDVLVKIDATLKEQANDFEIYLPTDANRISVDSKNTSTIKTDEGTLLKIEEPITTAKITYYTKSYIEETNDIYFVLDLSRISSDKLSALVMLPESATLKHTLTSNQPSFMPKTERITTDGKRIILAWNEKDFSTSQAILIIYNKPKDYLFLISIIFILLFIMTGVFFTWYLNRKYGQPPAKLSDGFTRNLFEEEAIIVKVLLMEPTKELWQKQLESKTGMNKVKLSRKLRSLEQKGLIERVPYGNTNKIRVKV